MRENLDVSAFLDARWPALVRVLVLMGVPSGSAPRLAARTRGAFARAHRRGDGSGDLDVELFAALLDLLDEPVPREPWWRDAGSLADRSSVDLEAELDQLTSARRSALALVVAGRLDDVQIAEITGVVEPAPLPHESELTRALGEVVAGVDVGSPATLDVRARRPRAVGLVASAVLVAILVVSAVSLRGVPGRTEPSGRPAPVQARERDSGALPAIVESRASDDDVPVVWYGAGELRLPGRALEVPDVTELAALRGGAVVARADASLTFVASDGAVTPIGRRAPGTGFAVSGFDLVAYLDESARPRVVVERFDPESRPSSLSTVLELDVSADTSVVAVDDDAVVLATPGRRWRIGLDGQRVEADDGVLDRAGGTTVRLLARQRVVVRRGAQRMVVPGEGAMLSADGRYALVRGGDQVGDALSAFVLVDTRRARPVSLPVGVQSYDLTPSGDVLEPAGNLARDAVLTPEGQVVLVVEFESGRPDQEDGPEPQYNLVVCDLSPSRCRPEAATVGVTDAPLLAH